MALDSTTRLAIAELIIYIFLLPLTFFLLIRHGKRGILGWLFLAVFCILRIISSALQIREYNQVSHGKPSTTTAGIVNSVGVSPLLLSVAGIIHEA
jgi:prolipoprotein diacylglyceryltransferase